MTLERAFANRDLTDAEREEIRSAWPTLPVDFRVSLEALARMSKPSALALCRAWQATGRTLAKRYPQAFTREDAENLDRAAWARYQAAKLKAEADAASNGAAAFSGEDAVAAMAERYGFRAAAMAPRGNAGAVPVQPWVRIVDRDGQLLEVRGDATRETGWFVQDGKRYRKGDPRLKGAEK